VFKMKKKEEIDREILERNYDVLLVFIGFTIVLLGVLNSFKKVPEEFLFGATLSGFFFALSDFNLLKDRFYKSDVLYNLLCLFFGVASFLLLPVFFMVFQDFYENIKSFGDAATFLALGFIIVGIGFKSMESKRKYINSITSQLNNTMPKVIDLSADLEKARIEIAELKAKHKETESNLQAKV
jgi:hypothetical protein